MKASVRPATARRLAESAATRYSAELHRFLRRRVGGAHDLEDLVQEVYLRLLRVKNSDLVRSPLAYIYGVASHVVSEFHMRRRGSRVDFDSEVADARVETNQEEESVESGGYIQQQVGEALAGLPAMQLAVLLLERRDGLSHAQIAERLGLSVHTVKKYATRALAHVRASLGNL